MNYIHLSPITISLDVPMMLIKHKPEIIVGCVLIGDDGEDVPDWFCGVSDAADLLWSVNNGAVLQNLDVFVVIREPGSYLNLNVLVCSGCCNFNSSGEGGYGGLNLLTLLSEKNINIRCSEVIREKDYYKKYSYSEVKREIENDFEFEFNSASHRWLTESWRLSLHN